MSRHPSVALLILSMLVIGCRPPDKEAVPPLRPFDFLIDWQAEPTYLGIYYAKHLGYYSRLGLDLNIVQSRGANQSAAAVAAGRYKIATSSGGATVLGYAKGEPLVSMAVIYPKISTVIYGLSSSFITTPADLKGKRIGIYPGSITKNEFDAFCKANDLDPKFLTIVSISGSDISLLLAHKIDAVLHYAEMSPIAVQTDTTNPLLADVPTPIFQILLSEHGVKGYGLNIISSRQSIDEEPQLIRQITEASIAGYKEGCADPDAATRTFLEEFPDRSPTYVRASWARVCELVGPAPGVQDLRGWQRTIDLYSSLGLLKAPIEGERLLP